MRKDSLKHELDDTDYALLALVQDNGRISNVKISEMLSLSETPCWRRLKRLEEKGYIADYQANLNRYQLGFGILALVQICFANHTDDAPEKFEEAVRSIPEIISCHNVTGEADYFLQIVSQDLVTYEQFLRKVLRNLPGVTSIQSSFSLREVKNSSRLPLGNSSPPKV